MPPSSLEIREATDADRLSIESMAREVVDDGTVFVFDEVADVLGYWYQSGGRVFVAERGGDTLGTYVIKPNQPGRGAHVANVGYMVNESARGLGVGTAMGLHSLKMAKELGFDAIQFNMVVATNSGAIHLWKNLGFETVGRLPSVFRHPQRGPVDALVMFRAL